MEFFGVRLTRVGIQVRLLQIMAASIAKQTIQPAAVHETITVTTLHKI